MLHLASEQLKLFYHVYLSRFECPIAKMLKINLNVEKLQNGSNIYVSSVAKAAFNIVRTNCCDGTCDLTRQIVSILPNGSNDYEILKTHKYTLISLGNHGRNLYRFGHFPGAYLITNYYTPSEQLIIANSMLTRHINPPNISNITKLNQNVTNLLDSENFLKKFKWATCGEQYDWGERKYLKSLKLDQEFLDLSQEITNSIYPEIEAHIPDAAIINLYNGNYHLNLHKEDAEESNAPVVTISLGKSAIFMLGRDDFNSLPMAIVVNSGDVFIISNECRFGLHGVAKLVHAPIKYSGYDVFGQPILIRQINRTIDKLDSPSNKSVDPVIDARIGDILTTCRISISIRNAKK